MDEKILKKTLAFIPKILRNISLKQVYELMQDPIQGLLSILKPDSHVRWGLWYLVGGSPKQWQYGIQTAAFYIANI